MTLIWLMTVLFGYNALEDVHQLCTVHMLLLLEVLLVVVLVVVPHEYVDNGGVSLYGLS